MRRERLDRICTALADRTRRGVVDLLRHGPRRAGELAERLDVSAPALSRHLRILRESQLIEATVDRGDGRVSVYRLRRAAFTALRGWVDEVEALWHDQITVFAAHVGRTRGKSKP